MYIIISVKIFFFTKKKLVLEPYMHDPAVNQVAAESHNPSLYAAKFPTWGIIYVLYVRTYIGAPVLRPVPFFRRAEIRAPFNRVYCERRTTILTKRAVAREEMLNILDFPGHYKVRGAFDPGIVQFHAEIVHTVKLCFNLMISRKAV